MKLADVKKINLAALPTPLQFMPNLTKRLGGGNLYIKRDDMTDVGLSGNKIRKLEYLVRDALDRGCNTLLTLGGPQTNHGRLTVAAAVKNNLKSVLILRGERPAYCSGNLLLDAMMGADIRFAGSEDLNVLAARVVKEYESRGDRVYSIPIGGSTALGALGYMETVRELVDQFKAMKIAPRYLVAACGSLGTFAGLWAGAKYYGAPFEVIPVTVEPKPSFDERTAADLINEVSATYELGISCRAEELKLYFGRADVSYVGLGYDVPDRETQAAMNLLARTEAIFLDPCYTGKAFHGFVDLVQNVFPKDAEAVFLHTGGIPALWSKEHLDAVQEDLWDGR